MIFCIIKYFIYLIEKTPRINQYEEEAIWHSELSIYNFIFSIFTILIIINTISFIIIIAIGVWLYIFNIHGLEINKIYWEVSSPWLWTKVQINCRWQYDRHWSDTTDRCSLSLVNIRDSTILLYDTLEIDAWLIVVWEGVGRGWGGCCVKRGGGGGGGRG